MWRGHSNKTNQHSQRTCLSCLQVIVKISALNSATYNLQPIIKKSNKKVYNIWKILHFFFIFFVFRFVKGKIIVPSQSSTFTTFATSHRGKIHPKLLYWKQYLVLPKWLHRVSPVCTHSGSASLVGRIHLYIAPRDGHSTLTFLRSCTRLQAIALTIPNPVNHVISGCYSRTNHSALQFGPVWWLSFLMLFGFMFSICQKIPFR